MKSIIPQPFLFRFSIPVRHVARMPKKGRQLLDLPNDCLLPFLGELEQSRPIGQVRLAWNSAGLGVSLSVTGKKMPPVGRLDEPTESDGLQVWFDTRNTQSIHRATRYCHHFCLLPSGGEKPKDQPAVIQLPIARAREEAPDDHLKKIRLCADRQKEGYRLEAWLPSEVLHGFDHEANPRLGFYYHLRDAELGEQFLTVGREFPFPHDPSLWSTLELVG